MKKYTKISEIVKKNRISYSILKLDTSLSIEDVIQEVYIKLYERDEGFLYNKVKQTLLDLYRTIKRKKIETISDNIIKVSYIDKDLNLENYIGILKPIDELTYHIVKDYFLYGYTYRELGKKYNISFNYVKKKIDKGLKILENHYKD